MSFGYRTTPVSPAPGFRYGPRWSNDTCQHGHRIRNWGRMPSDLRAFWAKLHRDGNDQCSCCLGISPSSTFYLDVCGHCAP